MRIIGGEFSGRRLASLDGRATRPTGDRVREALFNIWQGRLMGAEFWDVYAGTGAVGLEAMSRGASGVVFSENDRRALVTLHRNIALLGVGARVVVYRQSAEEVLHALAREGRRFDLIFMDPPWREGVGQSLHEDVRLVLQADGMVVVESRQSDSPEPFDELTVAWTRRYGDTRLTAYHRENDGPKRGGIS